MPAIIDNSFSQDSYGMRAERLNTIQGNFSIVQPLISAPANIVAWVEDCYDVFMDLWSTSDTEANEGVASTLDLSMKGTLMAEAYQDARNLAMALYHDDPVRFNGFGFDKAFPDGRNDQLARVKTVLDTHNNHVALGITHLLPAIIITRLTNTKADFEEAQTAQEKERNEAFYATSQLTERFDSDSVMLNLLKSWWLTVMGKKDTRIGLIGMVNPQSGGGAHVLPAPTDLSFYFPSLTFSWSEVPGASSYSLEYSPDGIVDYVEIYSGTDLEFAYTPPIEGTTFYKIRCRSAAGFSQYSPVLAQGYYAGLTLPAPSNLAVELVSGTTDSIQLSFGEVPSATNYKIYRSTANIGDVSGSFVYAGQSDISVFIETVSAGHRFYYRATAENPHQASGNSGQVWIEIA